MKVDEFTIKGGEMLFWRLGNMNSNKQKHWGDPIHRQPPTKRGIWCFPYPHYDLFFCYHQWEKRLPKKFRKEGKIDIKYPGVAFDYTKATQEEAEAYWKEEEEIIKRIRKEFHPTTFWYGGEFYSHISPRGVGDREWYYWDSAKEWAKVARKHLYWNDRYEDKVYTYRYSNDHLEIFIPNY